MLQGQINKYRPASSVWVKGTSQDCGPLEIVAHIIMGLGRPGMGILCRDSRPVFQSVWIVPWLDLHIPEYEQRMVGGSEKWPRNDHPGSSSIWRGCFFYRRSLLYHNFFYQRSLSDMVPPSHAVPSVLLPFKWFVRAASRQEICGQSWDLGLQQ